MSKQLNLIPLPVIIFEDEKVKPSKAGFYKCPFKCGADGFPQPKWLTEKGFRSHMTKCQKRPSLLAARAEIEARCTCLYLIDGEHADDCPSLHHQTIEQHEGKSFSEFMDGLPDPDDE